MSNQIRFTSKYLLFISLLPINVFGQQTDRLSGTDSVILKRIQSKFEVTKATEYPHVPVCLEDIIKFGGIESDGILYKIVDKHLLLFVKSKRILEKSGSLFKSE